ncbi:MAG TPA: peptidylprolyl isomerase [Pseudolabrys sp.]|nr:peptidylprolyl isomerase [Pseudolabrys sp.]
MSLARRLTALIVLVLVAATLGGCTKCGWIWDDAQKSCRADAPH